MCLYLLERLRLLPLRPSAVGAHHGDVVDLAELLGLGVDLQRQLPGGDEHESDGPVALEHSIGRSFGVSDLDLFVFLSRLFGGVKN